MLAHPGLDFQGGDGGGFPSSNGFGSPFPGGGGGGGGRGGSGTQDSGQKKARRNYDEQTLIPVSFQMIHAAKVDPSTGDGGLVLEDGRPLHTVKVVAAVRSAEDQSTNVMYVLEDGTASMDVKQWLDDNDSSYVSDLRRETTKDGVYVKVIGQVKEYENKKQIIANSVRPLSTGNELTHHILEVMYSAEKFKRADSIVSPVSAPVVNNLSNNAGIGLSSLGSGDHEAIRQQVFGVMRENDDGSEEGISIQQCIQFLPDIPEADIRKIVSLLSEEGQIYSTISEDHYKVAG